MRVGSHPLVRRGIVMRVDDEIPCRKPLASSSAYDSFAHAYNAHWGDYSLNWLRWCALMVFPRLHSRARLLDLCCGTGQLTGALSRRGFRMVGLDGSAMMLQYARMNAPDVPLLQADARQFCVRPFFDAVLSVFDSLNHLLNADDLVRCLCSAFESLRPGGFLFFDLNTEIGYHLHWNGDYDSESDDHSVRARWEYDPETRFAQFRAVVARCDASDSKLDEVVLWQRCHSQVEIRMALERAGFIIVEIYGMQGDGIMSGCLEGAERAFYLCRRPSSTIC